MTVYVDDARRLLGRMKMCHMLADTDEELDAMAVRIFGHTRYRQEHRGGKHYDLSLKTRAKAVHYGAAEITERQAAMINACKRWEGWIAPYPTVDGIEARYELVRNARSQWLIAQHGVPGISRDEL